MSRKKSHLIGIVIVVFLVIIVFRTIQSGTKGSLLPLMEFPEMRGGTWVTEGDYSTNGRLTVIHDPLMSDEEKADIAALMAPFEQNSLVVKVAASCIPTKNKGSISTESAVQSTLANIIEEALPENVQLKETSPVFEVSPEVQNNATPGLAGSLLGNQESTETNAERIAVQSTGVDRIVVTEITGNADMHDVVQTLNADPCVEYAEPNFIVNVSATPDDPYFSSGNSWGQGYEDLWGLKKIDAQGAWDAGAEGEGIVVAVIDTGVSMGHPDLAANLWTNAEEIPGNGIDDDGNGFIDDIHGWNFVSANGNPEDDHGHGTHVSGTIAAVGNNALGVIGIAPKAKIMAIKGLDASGNGSIANLAAGVQYAAANGAKVLNNSWGGPMGYNQTLADAFAYAKLRGAVSIAAAGNDSTDAASFAPANLEDVIAVAATTPSDIRATFSNYGNVVDIAAPGGDNLAGDAKYTILSTMSDTVTLALQKPGLKVAPGYWRLAGTSMAAPHVAGATALLLSKRPTLTFDEVKSLLEVSSVPFTPSIDKPIGAGRLNAKALVDFVGLPPTALLDVPNIVSGTVPIRGTAQAENFSSYTVEVGDGITWSTIASSSTAVSNNTLATWDTSLKADGIWTLRLRVSDTTGHTSTATDQIRIKNLEVTKPMNNDIYRFGDTVEIQGTIQGTFNHFIVEYGLGWDPTEWSSAGITSNDTSPVTNGQIALWDTSNVPEPGIHTLRVRVVKADGSTNMVTKKHLQLDPMIRAGWPKYVNLAPDLGVQFVVRVADLENDGIQDIIAYTPETPVHMEQYGYTAGLATLFVYRPDGSLKWKHEFPTSQFSAEDVPVIGDVDGDGTLEIVLEENGMCADNLRPGTSCVIHVIKYDGTELQNWPSGLPANAIATSHTKIVSDTNGDDKADLLLYSAGGVQIAGGYASVFSHINGQGQLLHNAQVTPNCGASYPPDPTFALAQLDSDAESEVIIRKGCRQFVAMNLDGSVVPGWPFDTGVDNYTAPAAADFDHDGIDEVIIIAPPANDTDSLRLFVLKADGTTMPGWPKSIPKGKYAHTSPSVGDIDGDGVPEIFLLSDGLSQCGIYGYHIDGEPVQGWPVTMPGAFPCDNFYTMGFLHSVVIGDIDGDGQNDVVFGGNGVSYYAVRYGELGKNGGIQAWKGNGTPIDLNGNLPGTAILTESAGAGAAIAQRRNAPILTDLDGDGTLEIVMGTTADGDKLRGSKFRNSITVWNLPASYNSSTMEWPMQHANLGMTGRYQPPVSPQLDCGNYIREGSELCDDGNNDGGDTCEANCTLPAPCTGVCLKDRAAKFYDVNKDGIFTKQELESRKTMCINTIKFDTTYNLACDVTGDKKLSVKDIIRLIIFTIDPRSHICGNKIVEESETCDDGNNVDDDGCSALCR